MNKQYRLIWNQITQTWVAVAENARACGKRASGAVSRAAAGLALAAACGQAGAAPPSPSNPPAPTQLPTGGQVVAGQATITQSNTPNAATLNINQTTNRAALDWTTFNVGSQARVNFNQPSSSSVTLNRVLDANPSQIFGQINANGQVYLSNPSGVYFAPGASADVGGLVATTHSISNADFMAGGNTFNRNGVTGSVVNEGTLKASLDGYIALLAPEVRNSGVIVAQMGTVVLAAGEVYELQFDANHLTNVRVEPATIAALVENGLAVQAPGGLIILSAQAANRLQGGVINNTGRLEATGLALKNGRVVLNAGANGLVQVGGNLDVSNQAGGGGQIGIEAKVIVLLNDAELLATGGTGGGTVLVGGERQGSGDMLQAASVRMDPGALINASATTRGDGGQVTLWSDVHNPDGQTTVAGKILAKGGAQSGTGGQVETSGHALDVNGINVDAGQGGQWLLDPSNIVIATSGGTVTPTTITNTLNAGTNVTLNTTPGSGGSGDINVRSAIASTGTTAGAFSLIADRDIALNANITLTGTSQPFLAQAAREIIQGTAVNVLTNGGNITYQSNSTNAATGGVYLTGSGSLDSRTTADRTASTNTTGGGSILISGGSNPTTGYASNIATGNTIESLYIGSSQQLLSGTNVGVELANSGANPTYVGVLQPNGGNATNYTFSYVNGDYRIVPANQLLVKISNINTTYGGAPTYAVTQAKYLASDNSTIVDLTGNVSVTGNLVTLVDGTGGSAQFTVAPSATVTSSSGQLAAGNYQLGATGAGGNSSNFSNTITVVGAYTVGRKGVTANGNGNGNGISKTYDGTTGMQGINLALNGKLSGDFLDVNGSGAFSQSNTGANLGYTVSAMSLGGADANDYFLASGSSFTGSNGVILPKAVTLTAPIAVKGYDGALTYLISASELAALSSQLGVGGNSVSAAAVNYVDKNAGQGNKVVTLDAVTINDGNSGGNFNITRAGNNASTINQAALVIVASNDSKLQDGVPFVGGAGIQPSGFVAGEGLSSLAGLLAYSGDSQGAVSAGTYSIVPQGLTSNNYAIQFVPGTLVINGSTPVVVVPRGTNGGGSGGDTGSGAGGSGGLTEPGSVGTTGSGSGPYTDVTNALRISIIKVATISETGLLRVYVPSATKATSAGFTFKLPDQIIDGIPENASITATMTDGSALPPWLKFDLSTRTFTATSLPPGALPLRVIVNISGRTYVVEIVESSN